jgi:RNA ligase
MGRQNRIVVDYGDYEGLVLLGAFDTKSGEEIPHSSLFFLQESGFELVMTYKTWGETYDLLKEEISNDREGYVIRFKNGFRMKIKGEEYKRLHKILTNFSSKDIWELMKEGKPMDEFLDRVPDEFYKWVKQQVSSFELALERISNHCSKIHEYFRYGKYNDVDPEPSKKDFALHLEKCNVETFYRPILFAMWDGKPYEHIIWRIMKPKFEKPFKNDET